MKFERGVSAMTDFHRLKETDPASRTIWDGIIARGRELYQEYCRRPIGAHSPDLQFILQHFRKAPVAGKFVLVAIVPHKKWALGRLTGRRGDPVHVDETIIFDDIEEAERFVFRQRWRDMTGKDPGSVGGRD